MGWNCETDVRRVVARGRTLDEMHWENRDTERLGGTVGKSDGSRFRNSFQYTFGS